VGRIGTELAKFRLAGERVRRRYCWLFAVAIHDRQGHFLRGLFRADNLKLRLTNDDRLGQIAA
jgi:hypothetical protein